MTHSSYQISRAKLPNGESSVIFAILRDNQPIAFKHQPSHLVVLAYLLGSCMAQDLVKAVREQE